MEAFWCIVLSFFVIKAFIKSERNKKEERRSRNTVKERWDRIERRKQREKEADELITVILPTINNGK